MIFGSGEASGLRAQIRALEQDILAQQEALGQQTRALDASIRQRLSAPETLLWVAAAGFLLGELSPSAPAPAPAPPPADQSPAANTPRKTMRARYKVILQYLALIRSTNAALALWHTFTASQAPATQPSTPPITPVSRPPQPGSTDAATQAPS
jgi:hypothetical protein